MNRSDALPYTNIPLPTHCPVTGLPIYSHSSWTYASPGGDYRLQVSFIGDRIVWLQPKGYVRLKYAQAGMALLEDVLFSMMPKSMPFIAVDDYSAVSGASLNARRFIIQALRQEQRLRSYIAYGAPRIFRLGLELSRRFAFFPFEVIVAPDYEAAAAAAGNRLGGMEAVPDDGLPDSADPSHGVAADGRRPLGGQPDALAPYAGELLEVVGRITLEPYGMAAISHTVALEHPFRPVYDALAILREDMQAILERHREAREKLEVREKEVIAKQAALNEAHTALNVLYSARQEERRRLEERIKSRFQALLQPLVDGFESTATTPRQRDVVRLLNRVLRHIGACLACQEAPLPAPFTARERLIACLLILGESPRRIARLLELSPRTIQNHCQRMRSKIGLQGSAPTLRDWLTQRAYAGPHDLAGRRP